MVRVLQMSACIIILMWGIRTASHLLLPLWMAALVAYGFVSLRINSGANDPAGLTFAGRSFEAK